MSDSLRDSNGGFWEIDVNASGEITIATQTPEDTWSDSTYSSDSWTDETYTSDSWTDDTYSSDSWTDETYSSDSWADESYD